MANLLKRFRSGRSKSYTSGTGERHKLIEPDHNTASSTTENRKPSALRKTSTQRVYDEVGMSPMNIPRRSQSTRATIFRFKSASRRSSWGPKSDRHQSLPLEEEPGAVGTGLALQDTIVENVSAEKMQQADSTPHPGRCTPDSFSHVARTAHGGGSEPEYPAAREFSVPVEEQISTQPVSSQRHLSSSENHRASTDAKPLARYPTPPPPDRIRAELLNRHSVVARKPPAGIVTLNVNGTHYYIHKDYLTHHSDYFRSALDGPWIECTERHVDFNDEAIEVPPFNVLVHWLYTQRLPQNLKEWTEVAQVPARKIELVKLKTLVLADRFMMPKLMAALNNDLVDSRMPHAPFYELIIYAFSNLPPSTPLLRALVDLHCKHWNPAADLEDEEEMALRPHLPHEFLMNVMIRFGELKKDGKGKSWTLDARDYYIEEDALEADV